MPPLPRRVRVRAWGNPRAERTCRAFFAHVHPGSAQPAPGNRWCLGCRSRMRRTGAPVVRLTDTDIRESEFSGTGSIGRGHPSFFSCFRVAPTGLEPVPAVRRPATDLSPGCTLPGGCAVVGSRSRTARMTGTPAALPVEPGRLSYGNASTRMRSRLVSLIATTGDPFSGRLCCVLEFSPPDQEHWPGIGGGCENARGALFRAWHDEKRRSSPGPVLVPGLSMVSRWSRSAGRGQENGSRGYGRSRRGRSPRGRGSPLAGRPAP